MRTLRYDGPGHRLNMGDRIVERGEEFAVPDEQAEALIAQGGLDLVEIEPAADDGEGHDQTEEV